MSKIHIWQVFPHMASLLDLFRAEIKIKIGSVLKKLTKKIFKYILDR